MRFHNSHGDTSIVKKVYRAFAEKYDQQCNTKRFCICHKSNVMLGMLECVLTSSSAYLSIETEKVIDKKWELRKAHFEKMRVLFESVFANVTNTKSGSKYKSVI